MDPVQQMAEALSARAALRAAADAELAQRIAAEHQQTPDGFCTCPQSAYDDSETFTEHLVLIGILAGRAAR